ncbi:acyl-CoA dehydrogenase family protein [Ruixingdingia sedimenti]|uniref:Acyl-CoA dehydrogenase family protein n=1 Tax=Ruixingdingia sedimenti TaxID=3073604 RepID=A0ABU1FDP9_9RHOB|nr:acyl-CoA dehydrogenase family protein [Xinfangfangia sp. LG-4]MDR5654512.1 acyl-CoA dehydrogenase family protein [Xinfangfangia sp. LG-4]
MTTARPAADLPTHEVTNQPVPEAGDLWAGDPALRHWAGRAGADAAALAEFGALAGTAEMRAAGRAANRHPPELRAFDRGGRRLDEVEFHPAWHRLMDLGLSAGYAAVAWEGRPGGHATHASLVYALSQIEPGCCCPMTMTYAAVPALAADAGLSSLWHPRLTARAYDPAPRPVADKGAATMGMAMTEKQGGSDVRANATRALRDGAGWRLTGHKWFCSAPMSDGFLTLAQAPGGLTCFVVPRWLPDGDRNAVHLMRLKDKLGNRANASAEIEYHGAWAEQLGEEGDGVRTIIEMVHHTRLDTAIAPAGLMRAALAEAAWWCRGRTVFQRRLIDQPLMRAVLADLALDWEGALALGLHVARAFDAGERPLARIGVALAKFHANKRCPVVVAEAMEVLGGMGYVEDTPLPLLYREAPLNGIWEGSGNVICLDILRSLARDTAAAAALTAELDAARGADPRYDAALADLRARWPALPPEAEARFFAERLALLLTASVLIRGGVAAVAEGYVATRLTGDRGMAPGTVAGLDTAAILSRLG